MPIKLPVASNKQKTASKTGDQLNKSSSCGPEELEQPETLKLLVDKISITLHIDHGDLTKLVSAIKKLQPSPGLVTEGKFDKQYKFVKLISLAGAERARISYHAKTTYYPPF